MNESPITTNASDSPSLSRVVIALLKGIVYQENDPALWNQLTLLEARTRDYVAVLGLDLVLDESEGYAFLRSADGEVETGSEPALPRLVPRRPLSFPVSLLLALLRKKLVEFDASGGGIRLMLMRDEIAEMMRLFLPTRSNEARLADQIETHLNKIVDLGFIRRLKASPAAGQQPTYEVRRILKAFVDAQWLADFDQRLETYRQQLTTLQEDGHDDAS